MILVFGNGQLAQELARAAAASALPVTTWSRAEVDIAEDSAVVAALSRVRPALVVNAAAYTKVDLAETDVDAARRSNEIGPAVLARACAAVDVPMVHISTDYVFDGTKPAAYRETDPVSPVSVYGRTKAAGERNVRGASRRHVIVRTAWLYSEFGRNFLKTMLHLAATRDELRVVDDQRGTPTSARELAQAILRISPRLIDGDDVWGTYHFTADGVATWYEFARRIVAIQAPLTGQNPAVLPIRTADYPTAVRRPANSQLDCSLFARTFGFTGRPWTEHVDATVTALAAAARTRHVA